MRLHSRLAWSAALTVAGAISVLLAFIASAHFGVTRPASVAMVQGQSAARTGGAFPPAGLATRPSNASPGISGNMGRLVAQSRIVNFAGRRFQVPADWQVTDLSADPTACVRFDRHVVYLGTPGPQERCRAQGVAHPAGAMVITASTSTAGARVVQDNAGHSITASAPGVTVEASYGDDPSEVLRILASARLDAGATSTSSSSAVSGANSAQPLAPVGQRAVATVAAAAIPATSGMVGLGFDACAAPSAAAMQAWRASPFTTVGIYIGGADRACAQPNLTAAWVTQQAAAGWRFLPLYAGPQVLYGEITAPQTQAVQAADDAVAQAAALGFTRGSVIYYDLEAYQATDSATAVALMSAWTQEVHNKGYLSGIYSSENSGIADLVANLGKIAEPDVIDVANWNGLADSDPGADPTGHWTGRRVHQFLGGTNDSPTYGGFTINIDQDYVDLAGAQCDVLVVPTVSATPSSKLSAGGSTSQLNPCVTNSN